MKPLFTVLLIPMIMHASGPFTLSQLQCLRTYVKSDVTLFDAPQLLNVQKMLDDAVRTLGFHTQTRDCPTLMIRIDAVGEKAPYALYTKIALGEEVSTQRKKPVETFVLSYEASDFVLTDEPKEALMDSAQYLIEEFVAHANEDKE